MAAAGRGRATGGSRGAGIGPARDAHDIACEAPAARDDLHALQIGEGRGGDEWGVWRCGATEGVVLCCVVLCCVVLCCVVLCCVVLCCVVLCCVEAGKLLSCVGGRGAVRERQGGLRRQRSWGLCVAVRTCTAPGLEARGCRLRAVGSDASASVAKCRRVRQVIVVVLELSTSQGMRPLRKVVDTGTGSSTTAWLDSAPDGKPSPRTVKSVPPPMLPTDGET